MIIFMRKFWLVKLRKVTFLSISFRIWVDYFSLFFFTLDLCYT